MKLFKYGEAKNEWKNMQVYQEVDEMLSQVHLQIDLEKIMVN
jgi:hypothetical protein